jgi:hypothetical protein
LLNRKFYANLIQICKASEAGPSFTDVINSYNNPSPIKDDDTVAILHVSGTTSFHAVHLKHARTLKALKEKVRHVLGAELNYPTEQLFKRHYNTTNVDF